MIAKAVIKLCYHAVMVGGFVQWLELQSMAGELSLI